MINDADLELFAINPALWDEIKSAADFPPPHWKALFELFPQIPTLRAEYERRGIPEKVFRDTLADVGRWVETHAERTGKPGFTEIAWLRQHFMPNIFALGRLQFQSGVFSNPATLLRSRKTGEEVLIMTDSGAEITAAGIYASAEGAGPAVTKIVYDPPLVQKVRGDGRINLAPEVLDLGGYEVLAQKGDPVLGVHIPCGSPLAADECAESIAAAPEFFAKYFPDRPTPKAFICGSWLLDPELPKILPPTSNIVRFQKLFHTFPDAGANAAQTFERLRKGTSLYEAVMQRVAAGWTPCEACGIRAYN